MLLELAAAGLPASKLPMLPACYMSWCVRYCSGGCDRTSNMFGVCLSLVVSVGSSSVV
jgi:hypothetical protein